MSEVPTLPPIYRPVRLDADREAAGHSRTIAAEGAEPATLVWSDDPGKLDCAIVLTPSEPWSEAARVIFCGAIAMGDALASVLPPGVDVDFAWPGKVRVNGRRAASISLHAPEGCMPEQVPEWLVLGAELLIAAEPKGVTTQEPWTTLHFENCPEITMPDTLAAFARHFLAWINRWQEDGFEPVQATWQARAYTSGNKESIAIGDTTIDGTFEELTEGGHARVMADGLTTEVSLLFALSG